jgi:hypothetical protein
MKPTVSLLCLLMLGACAPQVLVQSIPVSTDPIGVKVVADGKTSCTAPCQVSLARNQDHILTLTKDGYRQQDVIIKRQYQTNKVLLNALNEGVHAGNFYNDGFMGAYNGVNSVNSQEDTGEAYVLSPSTISLRMVPVGGFPARVSSGQIQQAASFSPLDIMSAGDQQMLENALENSRSGATTAWSNAASGASFSVVPEHASEDSAGHIVRWFTLGARQNAQTATGRFPAQRVGRGEWAVSLPLNHGDADGDKGAEAITRHETLRALGQTDWPSAGKSWEVGSSGSTHTSSATTVTPSGTSTSTTTTSTKTSAKAGVNVSPGAVANVLDALTGADK